MSSGDCGPDRVSDPRSMASTLLRPREIQIARGVVIGGTDNLFSMPNQVTRSATSPITNVGSAALGIGTVIVGATTNCVVTVIAQPPDSSVGHSWRSRPYRRAPVVRSWPPPGTPLS